MEVKIVQLYKDQSAGSGSGKCTAPEENREVMVESLRKTFSRVGTFDPTAVVEVHQWPQKPWMDRVPSAAEISEARSLVPASPEVMQSSQASSGRVRQKIGPSTS